MPIADSFSTISGPRAPYTKQETERLMSDSPPGISAAPNEENLRHFDVTVSGPESSPYEGE
jgi:ubiquitin-conjugating enzyme E2 N